MSTFKYRVVVGVVLLSMAGGCKSCDRDRPYIPYTIGSSSASPSISALASAAAPSSTMDGGTFTRIFSAKPPPGATTWTLDGLALNAPPGKVFQAGLIMAAEGDSKSAAVVVGDGGAMGGEVLIYRTDPSGKLTSTSVTSFPTWLPTGAGCTHHASLAQIGKSTLWIDLVSVCDKQDVTKPNRWLAALSTTAQPAQRTELRVLPLSASEALRVDADASDRDNDTQDDLVVQLGYETSLYAVNPGAPLDIKIPVTLKYFERGSGLTRESDEPSASLKNQGNWFAAQAAKAGKSSGSIRSAQALRQLFRVLCAEGGAPKITANAGAPINCGDASVLDDARYAEARAHLSANEWAPAYALGQRLGEGGASRRAAEFEKALGSAAKVVKAKANPLKTEPGPSVIALPITFASDGKLLVRTTDGVTKVDVATGAESQEPKSSAWSSMAELVGDFKVERGADPCTGGPIEINVASVEVGLRKLASPVMGGTAPRCSHSGGLGPFLLHRNGDGLFALVQGESVFVTSDGQTARAEAWPTGPGVQGSIRSPDGQWAAIAGGDSVLIVSGGKAELWKPSVRFNLMGCTVANDAKAVACLIEKGIVVLTP